MRYAPHLARQVDRREPLKAGSREEIKIPPQPSGPLNRCGGN